MKLVENLDRANAPRQHRGICSIRSPHDTEKGAVDDELRSRGMERAMLTRPTLAIGREAHPPHTELHARKRNRPAEQGHCGRCAGCVNTHYTIHSVSRGDRQRFCLNGEVSPVLRLSVQKSAFSVRPQKAWSGWQRDSMRFVHLVRLPRSRGHVPLVCITLSVRSDPLREVTPDGPSRHETRDTVDLRRACSVG